MSDKKGWGRNTFLIGGLLVLAGYMAARLTRRLLSRPEETEDLDDNAPKRLVLKQNERRYPPFYDGEIAGIRVEGEFNEAGDRQLVVVGFDQKELNERLKTRHSYFAIARCDGAGLWHPAVAEDVIWYGQATDQHGDAYAVAAYVGPSILQVLPGITVGEHFTALRSTRLLAITNADGLLYDYPNVPIIHIT